MNYPKLFTPGKIGSLRIKNRAVMPPMQVLYGENDGHPGPRTIAYYEERAKGGVGFDGEGLAAPHEGELAAARLDEESVARMVDIMIRHLAKIRPKYGLIFRELFSGNTCPSQIAKALGLKKSQIYADVEKVRKLAAKIYFDLLEE